MTGMSDMGLQVDSIMREVNLERGQFFLGGSAGLALRGIRPIGGDIDVAVPTRYWMGLWHVNLQKREPTWRMFTTDPADDRRRCDPPYLYREVQGKEVHLFFAWRRRGLDETEFNDFNLVFREGVEVVHGWPCIKLELLLRQKVDALRGIPQRPKDIADVGLIARYLAAESGVLG